MNYKLHVNTYAMIGTGCSMSHNVLRNEQVEFRFGGNTDGFEMIFTCGSLRAFAQVAATALAEAEAKYAADGDEDDEAAEPTPAVAVSPS